MGALRHMVATPERVYSAHVGMGMMGWKRVMNLSVPVTFILARGMISSITMLCMAVSESAIPIYVYS